MRVVVVQMTGSQSCASTELLRSFEMYRQTNNRFISIYCSQAGYGQKNDVEKDTRKKCTCVKNEYTGCRDVLSWRLLLKISEHERVNKGARQCQRLVNLFGAQFVIV